MLLNPLSDEGINEILKLAQGAFEELGIYKQLSNLQSHQL